MADIKWVSVGSFPVAYQANMVKSLLESEGIHCILQGEHSSQILSHMGSATAMNVLVKKHQFESAKKLIKEAEANMLASEENKEESQEEVRPDIKQKKSDDLASKKSLPDFENYAWRASLFGVTILPMLGSVASIAFYFIFFTDKWIDQKTTWWKFRLACVFNFFGLILLWK